MRIGIFLNVCGTLHTDKVWWEEVVAADFKKYLSKHPKVEFVEYYGTRGPRTIETAPKDFDVVIHLDPLLPNDHSKCNVIQYEISDLYFGGFSYYDRYDWRFSYGRRFADKPRTCFFPTPVDIENFHPMPEKQVFDVCFAGNDFEGQQLYVEPVVGKFKCSIHGCFKNPPIDHDNLPKLYNQSKICLNRHRSDHIYFDMWSNRAVEVAACGAFMISDNCAVEQDMFKGNIVATTGGADLIEKVKYYLEHEDERKAKAAAAMEIVVRDWNTKKAVDIQMVKLCELTGK